MAAATPHREHRRPNALSRTTDLVVAPGLAGWLSILIFCCLVYAAFADGAAAIQEESRVQVGLAVALLIAAAGLATGALGIARSALAWAGAGALACFALFCAISVTWSVAPDLSWIAANRAAEYTALVAVLLVAAPSLYRAPQWALGAFVGLALCVAAYALGGKVLPQLSIGPVDLDQASQFSRLRAPLGYWNALGLLLVMATPACISTAADRSRGPALRLGGLLALQFLLVTIALTYSRGALLALAIATAVLVAAGPDRLRRLGVAALGLIAAAPASAFAFGDDQLSHDGIAAAQRASDGRQLLAILVGSMLALAAVALFARRAEDRMRWSPARTRGIWRLVTLFAVIAAFVGLASLASSQRGITGTVSHQWDEFRKPAGIQNDPGRLISSNGSNRWIWWREAAGAFSDKPLAGWGAGSFPILHDRYREYQTQVRSAHSVPLQFLAETGVAGAALALGALALLFAAAIRTTRTAEGSDRTARVALLAAAAAWAVHCLVDWDWEIPALTLPALAALAIAAAPWGPDPILTNRSPRSRSGRRLRAAPRRPRSVMPVLVFAALAAVALAVSSALPVAAEDRRLDALREAGDAGSSVEALSKAAADAREAHKLNPLDADALLAEATIEARLGKLPEARSLLLQATRLEPDNYRVWDALIVFGEQNDDGRLAELALQQRVAAEPLSFSADPTLTSGIFYSYFVPPQLSPTAFGTPPPGPGATAPGPP
jgi:tetratricopeptide (TPR) repeat protein